MVDGQLLRAPIPEGRDHLLEYARGVLAAAPASGVRIAQEKEELAVGRREPRRALEKRDRVGKGRPLLQVNLGRAAEEADLVGERSGLIGRRGGERRRGGNRRARRARRDDRPGGEDELRRRDVRVRLGDEVGVTDENRGEGILQRPLLLVEGPQVASHAARSSG